MTLRHLLLAAAAAALPAAGYDPLAVAPGAAVQEAKLAVRDSARNREIPVRVVLPAAAGAAPVLLFSHGLGGSREGSAYLGEHWSRRGYVTVYLQHPGSDDSAWKGARAKARRRSLEDAASAQNLLLRLGDVKAVLDQLEAWNRAGGHALSGRLRMDQVGMSGHSFGALTTQGVSGQSFPMQGVKFTDKRIRAAVIMSPGSPRRGGAEQAFSQVQMPWMLMTGTRDVAQIGGQTLESRLDVYRHLPPGGKYELVLEGAEHSAFTDRGLPASAAQRNPNHHRVILALSTAFWDAYLRNDAAARAWLDGPQARQLMQPGDRWQQK
jgi:predicted dienelactone hydrolase